MISSVEDTVPAGKVWKMESILTSYYFQYGGGSSCTNDVNAREVWINGASKIIQGQGVGTGSTNIYLGGYSMPFWIPAGTRVRTTCATTLLSIIEFNIVP